MDRILIATGSKFQSLYYLDVAKERALKTTDHRNYWLWHKRLGHPSPTIMKKISYHMNNEGFKDICDEPCENCILGKSTKNTYHSKPTESRSKEKLRLVHSDICGPMTVQAKVVHDTFSRF